MKTKEGSNAPKRQIRQAAPATKAGTGSRQGTARRGASGNHRQPLGQGAATPSDSGCDHGTQATCQEVIRSVITTAYHLATVAEAVDRKDRNDLILLRVRCEAARRNLAIAIMSLDGEVRDA